MRLYTISEQAKGGLHYGRKKVWRIYRSHAKRKKKAVSKWERGLGFPEISPDTAAVALTDTFELVKLQRKAERRSILKIAGCIAAALFLIFLIDGMGWMGFAFAYFPVICLIASVALVIYGIWRKKNKLPCLQTFILAGALILIPICIVVLFFLAGVLGLGPVPN